MGASAVLMPTCVSDCFDLTLMLLGQDCAPKAHGSAARPPSYIGAPAALQPRQADLARVCRAGFRNEKKEGLK